MLEVAFLGAHLLWMMAGPDLEVLYDAVTTSAARSIGLQNHRLEIGAPAHLVVVQGESVAEALRFHAAPRAVVSHGRLVDQAAMRELAEVPG